jgi:hypothetical protein
MSTAVCEPMSPCTPTSFITLFSNPEFRTALKGFVIDLVKNDMDFRESIREAFDYSVATSDLKILKRISTLESMLITDELNFDDEEHEPTIPEQIKTLSDRLEQPLNKSTEETIQDFYIPHTTLDLKACELVRYLKEDVKPRNNEVFLNSREIINYLKTSIPEELRLKDVRNPRQAKKDILEKAVKLFSDTVLIIRNKSGNKVTGLALKPLVKCRYTDTC